MWPSEPCGANDRSFNEAEVDMKIERTFTKSGEDAYAGVAFTTTASEIRNPVTTSRPKTVVYVCEHKEPGEPKRAAWASSASISDLLKI